MAPRGPHLAIQMRERIVVWSRDFGKSTAEIADLAGCCERTVQNILRYEREYGVVNNPFVRKRAGPRTLDTGDVNYIASLISANPVLYLDEIQERLQRYQNVDVCLSTISRTLHHIALSNKKVANEAAEQNELLCAVWQAEYGNIPADYCVWLDESSVDNRTNQRTSGWAEVGRACIRCAVFVRGTRFSVLPAFTCEGYIALDIFEGSVNKEKFLNFLEEQVAPKLNPYPGPRSIVILDNCSIHHNEEVCRLIVEECGAKLIYLPPYSPDFNPIEQSFHSLKAWLRRHEEEALNPECQPWLIYQAAESLTPEMAEGWIKNCGYSFLEE